MRLLLVLLLSLATSASAQTFGVSGDALTGSSSRSITVCIVPDIQNIVSQSDFDAEGGATSCPVTSGYCTGSSCTASPYCSGNWHQTGRIMLANMAYSLTGQWSQVDYSAIRGADAVLSRFGTSLDHGKCDLIVGVGDYLDTISGSGDPSFASLSATYLRMYSASLGFWRIIKDSGIPFLPARGNHDPEQVFAQMMTDLGFASLPFYYDSHSEGDQYAIKFSTQTGKDFCVLSMDDNALSVAGDRLTASEAAWVTSTVGCGDELPTIIVRHDGVDTNGALNPDPVGSFADVIADANNDEVFMLVGGHHTPTPIASYKGTEANVSGKSVLKLFSNWQEADRHASNVGGTGITASDGAGGEYTVVGIDADVDRICAHDWNPYWQKRGNISTSSIVTTSICIDFDFDARFE